jgi:hypothetical protein
MSLKINIYKKTFTVFFIIICFLFLSCTNVYFGNLEVPENVKVTSITCDSAVVGWKSVRKAKYYDVTWQIKGSKYVAGSMIVEDIHCQLEDLVYCQEYIVKVAALFENRTGNLFMSDYVTTSFTTLEDVPPEGELARPNNVVAKYNKDESTITISWDAVKDAAYYDINIKDENPYYYGPGLNIVKIVPAEKTEFVYKDSIPTNKMIIKVAARNSDFSDTCRWSYEVSLE